MNNERKLTIQELKLLLKIPNFIRRNFKILVKCEINPNSIKISFVQDRNLWIIDLWKDIEYNAVCNILEEQGIYNNIKINVGHKLFSKKTIPQLYLMILIWLKAKGLLTKEELIVRNIIL